MSQTYPRLAALLVSILSVGLAVPAFAGEGNQPTFSTSDTQSLFDDTANSQQIAALSPQEMETTRGANSSVSVSLSSINGVSSGSFTANNNGVVTSGPITGDSFSISVGTPGFKLTKPTFTSSISSTFNNSSNFSIRSGGEFKSSVTRFIRPAGTLRFSRTLSVNGNTILSANR